MPIPGVRDSWSFFKELSKNLNVDLGFNNFSELRSLMFMNHPVLSRISLIEEITIPKIKSNTVKLSKNLIFPSVKNFYMTDSVSRNSPVMSSCATAMLKK